MCTRYHGGPLHESSKEEIKKLIYDLKESCDYVVAVYHGGDEFIETPLPYTRRYLKKILKLGVDVIVAHHPHVVQGYECVGKKMIFYSLGNFLFDTDYQRIQECTDEGVLLRLIFTKENIQYEILPTRIERSTGKIICEAQNSHFKDIKEINYFQEWCKSCHHMQTIKLRKQQLHQLNFSKKKVAYSHKKNPLKKILKYLKRCVTLILLDRMHSAKPSGH